MPQIKRPIPESAQSVVRPVAIGVVQEVLIDRLGLPADMVINFPGPSETVAQTHGLISNKFEEVRFPTSDKIFLDITERPIDFLMNGNVVDHPEHIPLFLNQELEVEIRPIYVSMEMRLTIRYRAKNKTDAKRWYDYMLAKLPVKEDTWLHTLKYSFGIPETFMVILKEIHRLTELQAPHGDSWEEFATKWFNPRFGNLTDQAGKNVINVFSDTQDRCLGFFDISTEPDFGAKKDDSDVWEVEIPYVLRYEKPVDIWFSYPIVIHNTVLSKKFRPETGFERLQDKQSSRTWSMAHLQSFEAMENIGRPYNDHPGRYFPLFDEFRPRMVPHSTMRVFTSLVTLYPDDAPDPLLLMNLMDLEHESFGMTFTDCIKKYLKSEYQYLTTHGASCMHLALFRNRLLMKDGFLVVDENLNVRLTQPFSKRAYYHLRLSILTDMTLLNQDAQLRLRQMPCAFENLVDYISPEGVVRPDTPLTYDRITKPWFDEYIQVVKEQNRPQSSLTPIGRMKTVQYTTINGVYQMKK